MSSGPGGEAGFPALTGAAAGSAAVRRRRRVAERAARGVWPYLLIAPAAGVIVAVLGYPIYLLTRLSFQQYGLAELVTKKGTWIGLDNYSRILHDEQFWTVVARTFAFTAVNVGLTMLFGTLIALLLVRLGRFMRLLLTTGLVLVWATPVVVAVNIFRWMVDFEFGVLNWTLTKLHLGDFLNKDWFADPLTGFAVITAIVVWGAIPFVAITVYAGLSQVPAELVEAAQIDGAGRWRVFRDITFPLLLPIFVILTSLSIIWDFQVFNQVWLVRDGEPEEDYWLMSVYSFVEAFKLGEYGFGAAIAVVMVCFMFAATFVYLRQMIRLGETR
ncbi:MAG TPA: sugar ABC transporter permease [Gaiellaceae bacterium]|nr:sugar ABC transporter permease [Gaiellaceae bacterium]